MIEIIRIADNSWLLNVVDPDGYKHGEVCIGIEDLANAILRRGPLMPIAGWPR